MESRDGALMSIADTEKILNELPKSDSQDLNPFRKEGDPVDPESLKPEIQDLQPASSEQECDLVNVNEPLKPGNQNLQAASPENECNSVNPSEPSKSATQDSQNNGNSVDLCESSMSQSHFPQKKGNPTDQETESSPNDDNFNKSMSEILSKIKQEPMDDYEVDDSNDTYIHNANMSLDINIKPIIHRSRKRKRSKGRSSARGHSSNSHSSDISSVDRKLFPSRPGISFEVGARLKAKDSQDWYDAKITEIDEELGEVKVHFDRWNSRYDQWIKMDSKNLKALSPERLQKNNSNRKYKIGDEVLARWKDRQMYPAKVTKILDNASYMVKFYDGFVNKMQSMNMEPLPMKFSGKMIADSTSDQPPVSATKVAVKEFVIEEDHNQFKCQVADCAKSFRKEKLLESHMKHYHNMRYDPNSNVRSLRSSENLKSSPSVKSHRHFEIIDISPRSILETAETTPKDSSKVTKSASTPKPPATPKLPATPKPSATPKPPSTLKSVSISETDSVSETEPASKCEATSKTTQPLKTTVDSKILSMPKTMSEKPIPKPCRANTIDKKKIPPLPQRSSSRRISLPAKFANDEICLLQPIGRSSTAEKLPDKEKEEIISKSQKTKEQAQSLTAVTEENEKDVKAISIKIEPSSPPSCSSLSPRKETNRKSLEPIRKMVMDERLDPSRIEQIVTLKSNTRKDRSLSLNKARTCIPSPQPINPRMDLGNDKEVLAEKKMKPKYKRPGFRIARRGHYKGRRKDASNKTCFPTNGVSEMAHKNLSISEVSDNEEKSPVQVQNETSKDIAIKTSESDLMLVPNQVSDISTKSSSTSNDQLETNRLASDIATMVPSSSDVNVPNAPASNMVSELNSTNNDSVIASSKPDYQNPLLNVFQSQENIDIIIKKEKDFEGAKSRKIDLTGFPIIPRHVMCTRRKEAILEKEKASQAVGRHVMCTRKKSEKLAAVEEQFRHKMSSPTKSESPVPTSKPNKRRKFFLPSRVKLNASKLDSYLENETNNMKMQYHLKIMYPF